MTFDHFYSFIGKIINISKNRRKVSVFDLNLLMIYLSTGEVAKLLGISKRTLQNWLKLEKITIPEKGNNGYYLWSMADVQIAQQYKNYIETTTHYVIGTGTIKNGL